VEVTDTVVYYAKELITIVKSYATQALGLNVIYKKKFITDAQNKLERLTLVIS
jgi:hypothetical protein